MEDAEEKRDAIERLALKYAPDDSAENRRRAIDRGWEPLCMLDGKIRILEDAEEKRDAIERLALKYAPDDSAENRRRAIDRGWEPLCMLEMTIDHLSGKEAIELVRRRPQPYKLE